jgi:palmitoyltransferase
MVQRRSRSLTYDEDQENPLCLCEYYNKNNERVHILMCCCNCQALDEMCTTILCSCCKNKQNCKNLFQETLADIGDRLRYPMIGGARTINIDFIISLVTLLIYVLIGTINGLFSLIAIVLMPCFIFVRFFVSRLSSNRLESALINHNNNNSVQKPKIKIAYYMISNCLIICFILYNVILHKELLPVQTENEQILINLLLVTAILVHFGLKMSNPGFIASNHISNPDDVNYCLSCNLKRDQSYTIGHCPICRQCTFGRDHHCFYVDNCIGYLNHKLFIFYLFNLNFLFVYSFYTIFKLLNNLECNLYDHSCLFNVYYSNFSRSFLTLLFFQLAPIIIFVNVLILQQFIFIGIGLTQYQLYKMSQKNMRFSLFFYISDNFSITLFLKNIILFCKWRKKTDLIRNLQSGRDHFI